MFVRLVTAGLSLFVSVGVSADDKSITNKQLIAAMPPGADSVMIMRLAPLAAKESILRPPKEIRDKMPAEELANLDVPFLHPTGYALLSGPDENAIDRLVNRAVYKAGPVAWATGGSGFAGGGIGLGNFVVRTIWVVREELPPIGAIVTPDNVAGDLKQVKVENIPAYHSEVQFGAELKKRIWVSRPTPHTVVLAESKEELAHMIRAIRTSATEIPKRWKHAVAGLPLESPIVVLRKYNPADELDSTSPINPKKPPKMRVEIDSLGVALPSAAAPTLQLTCVSSDPEQAMEYYRGERYRYYVLPEIRWEWQAKTVSDGFQASVRFKSETGANHHIELVLFQLFGMNIGI